MFGYSLQLLSETFIILRKTKRDNIINLHRYSGKVPNTLVRFESNFSKDFRKIFKHQTSRKSVQWGPRCPMLTDRHEEDTIVAFRTFANKPKK
jgi:hypothetical protein